MDDKSKVPHGKVVTRFAPSPTGFLHIGGARTALFNWLYAKATGGTFLLRIEDTDRERSTDAAIDAIIDGMRWLGLDWDGEPIFQFARAARHAEVVDDMLARGAAYRCYLSPDELAQMRARAEAEKRPFTVVSPWRDRDPADAPAGVKPAIRLKAAQTGQTIIDDHVQGRVVFQNEVLDDLVILRSDGTPTYNLAVVVDDHDMGITHVIRGVDHLTNAARQTQIYRGMGWDVPQFAHVPLIHGPDGAKLSKRHGALGIEAYRDMGYLPEALRNYLVRLGWSHGDDEIFTLQQMIEWFDIDGIGKSAARFDFAKLADLNGYYIRQADTPTLIRRIKDILPAVEGGPAFAAAMDRIGWNRLETIMPGLKDRAKTLRELIDSASFLVASRPLPLDPKAAALLDGGARDLLKAVCERLATVPRWAAADLEAEVRAFSETSGQKLGKVAQPLRAALTGRAVSPPVFDVLGALGREESLARIADQLR
ncbi:MAG: glutamate--tRNA ligase [Hyphomicrobiaceae bacterium]